MTTLIDQVGSLGPWGWLGAAGAALLGLLFVFLRGRAGGEKKQELRAAKDAFKAEKEAINDMYKKGDAAGLGNSLLERVRKGKRNKK